MREARRVRPTVQDTEPAVSMLKSQLLVRSLDENEYIGEIQSFLSIHVYKSLAGFPKARFLSNVNRKDMEALVIISLGIIILIVLLGGWRARWDHSHHRTYRASNRRRS